MTRAMQIEYPAMLPDALQESPDEFEREARLAMAVKLFERKRVPSGIAAAMAGLPRAVFLLRLHDFGVPMLDLPAAEIAEDVVNA